MVTCMSPGDVSSDVQVRLECNIGMGRNAGVEPALEQWLPHLGALQRCHTVTLLGGAVTGPAAVRGGLAAASALQTLRGDVRDAHALMDARASLGLPAVALEDLREGTPFMPPGKWWMLPAPDVRYNSCAVLPAPQLNPTSCTAVRCRDA